MSIAPGDIGAKLFGSPALAIPLREKKEKETKTSITERNVKTRRARMTLQEDDI